MATKYFNNGLNCYLIKLGDYVDVTDDINRNINAQRMAEKLSYLSPLAIPIEALAGLITGAAAALPLSHISGKSYWDTAKTYAPRYAATHAGGTAGSLLLQSLLGSEDKSVNSAANAIGYLGGAIPSYFLSNAFLPNYVKDKKNEE